jgi:predicted small secreted protein
MVTLLVRGALGTMLAIGLAAGLGGCNTVEGFGKDMAAAGRALSGSAERNKGGSAADTSGTAESANSAATTSPAAGPGTTSSAAPVTAVTPTPLK